MPRYAVPTRLAQVQTTVMNRHKKANHHIPSPPDNNFCLSVRRSTMTGMIYS